MTKTGDNGYHRCLQTILLSTTLWFSRCLPTKDYFVRWLPCHLKPITAPYHYRSASSNCCYHLMQYSYCKMHPCICASHVDVYARTPGFPTAVLRIFGRTGVGYNKGVWIHGHARSSMVMQASEFHTQLWLCLDSNNTTSYYCVSRA